MNPLSSFPVCQALTSQGARVLCERDIYFRVDFLPSSVHRAVSSFLLQSRLRPRNLQGAQLRGVKTSKCVRPPARFEAREEAATPMGHVKHALVCRRLRPLTILAARGAGGGFERQPFAFSEAKRLLAAHRCRFALDRRGERGGQLRAEVARVASCRLLRGGKHAERLVIVGPSLPRLLLRLLARVVCHVLVARLAVPNAAYKGQRLRLSRRRVGACQLSTLQPPAPVQ
mmetsp:Transcript_30145/g.89790  ORF Transcript_30145/g.89790 Transcript_30145/m.89790 type:complete len:229 (-) Transcript_30145:72-758(-)